MKMAPKTKVYFLVNELKAGGSQRVIINIAGELSEKYDVWIITLGHSNFYTVPKNVTFYSLSNLDTVDYRMLLLFPLLIDRFRRLMYSERFIGGVSFLELANFLHIFSVGKGKAIISLRNSISSYTGFKGRLYKLCMKLLYPKCKKIIVNSEENKYETEDYLQLTKDQCKVVYNPINAGNIQSLAKKSPVSDMMGILHKKDVYVTVGRLVPWKHHEKILAGFSALQADGYTRWVYLIIGDGPQRKYLENLAEKLEISDKVHFLGNQKNPFSFLAVSHYFIYASEYEGFPNVLIEAMACDVPIITADFKTGARECILGDGYDKDGMITYPHYGPNGVLLENKMFVEQMKNVLRNLQLLQQKKSGFGKFHLQSVVKEREKLLV